MTEDTSVIFPRIRRVCPGSFNHHFYIKSIPSEWRKVNPVFAASGICQRLIYQNNQIIPLQNKKSKKDAWHKENIMILLSHQKERQIQEKRQIQERGTVQWSKNLSPKRNKKDTHQKGVGTSERKRSVAYGECSIPNLKTGGTVQRESKASNSQTMKVEGVDNEIAGNSLRARSKERKIDRALICLTASLQNRNFLVE